MKRNNIRSNHNPVARVSLLCRSAIAIAVAVTLSSCSSSESTAPEPQPAPAPMPQPKPESAPESSSDCLAVDEAMADGILVGATASGMTPVRASAVRSPDFEMVYFIAVEFTLAEAENAVGVWASNSLERGGGIILSADSFAKEFSDWGDAESSSAAISPADPAIRASRDCVKAASNY